MSGVSQLGRVWFKISLGLVLVGSGIKELSEVLYTEILNKSSSIHEDPMALVNWFHQQQIGRAELIGLKDRPFYGQAWTGATGIKVMVEAVATTPLRYSDM